MLGLLVASVRVERCPLLLLYLLLLLVPLILLLPLLLVIVRMIVVVLDIMYRRCMRWSRAPHAPRISLLLLLLLMVLLRRRQPLQLWLVVLWVLA